MVLLDICTKLLLFPFLTYLANIRGLCSNSVFPVTPVINYPTTIIINTTLPVNTTSTTTTVTTSTTPRPSILICPVIPLACLVTGASPIPGCPCIDPRQTRLPLGQSSLLQNNGNNNFLNTMQPQNNQFLQNNGFMNTLPVANQLPQPGAGQLSSFYLGMNTNALPQMQLGNNNILPQFPQGSNPILSNQILAQRSNNLLNSPQQEIITDTDVMIFSSLANSRRRKKRYLK